MRRAEYNGGRMHVKWPLTPSQIVLGAWALGVRDPAAIEELAKRYYDLPGINTFTPRAARRVAEELAMLGFDLAYLSPSDRELAEKLSRLLAPLLDGSKED